METALTRVKALVDRGYKEIVLTGIHLGMYGKDVEDGTRTSLAILLERIDALPGDEWPPEAIDFPKIEKA